MAKRKSKKNANKRPFEVKITKKMAKKAVLLVVNTLILTAMKTGLVKRKHLHIVVGFANGTILFEYSVGKRKKWENDYRFVARTKFQDTVNAGIPSRRIQSEAPHLASGKIPYYGSAIDKGIVVSASGVQAFWDEAFCKMIIAVILAFVYDEQEQLLTA